MELYSLQNLFSNRIFRIPDYQRGYSWSNQQLVEFWEDLVNLSIDKEHYTGMISIKKVREDPTNIYNAEKWLENQGYSICHIVDGQQRLTTCVILINEIVNFINNTSKDEKPCLNNILLSKIIEDYLVMIKPTSENQVKTYKFGYEVDNPSYEYFKYRILEDSNAGNIEETFYTLNLQNAKDFFKKRIEEIFEEEGLEAIDSLFVKLTQKLKFNLYEIDDDFNVFVAFETMNNRGKKLSNLELLKNRLIYLTTLLKNENDDEVEIRKKINDTWKTVYGYLGKNKDKSLNDDEFLQAHWIIYFGYSRSKTKGETETYNNYLLNKYFTQNRVFKNVVNSVDEEQQKDYETDDANDEEEIEEQNNNNPLDSKLKFGDIGNYADSLKEIVSYWYDINFPKESKQCNEINVWLEKINRIGFVYFKPLITVVLYKKDIDDDTKIKFLKAVERFIFLYFRLSGYFSTYRNSYFYNLAHDLYINEKTIDDVLNDLENIDIVNKNGKLMSSGALSKFERFFKNYKGYYSWNSLKYFLYEYECEKVKEFGNPKIDPEKLFKKDEKDKVSVEHIFPQTPDNSYWKERFEDYSEEERKCLTGSLGNLLPLSQSINSALQNDSFDEKKNGKLRGYYNGSHSEIEVSRCEEWTPQTILQRGLRLLNFMEKRWNFRFKSTYEKYKMLSLTFMFEEELSDDSYEQVALDEDIDKKTRIKITNEMIKCVFDNFKDVALEKISYDDALNNIIDTVDMNPSSANMYLYALVAMLNGNIYKRKVKAEDLQYFLNRIKEEFGSSTLENAKKSVRLWIEYAKGQNMNTQNVEEIINNI